MGKRMILGNTLYTMALELLLPGFRRSFPWGEEKLGDLVEGLLWVWSPEFMASKDLQQEADQTRRQHYMNIQWLLQCAEPPVSQDLTMIGFLHGWFFLCFHAFESHWLHTTVLKRADPSELLPKQRNAGTIGSNGSEVGPDSDAGVRV